MHVLILTVSNAVKFTLQGGSVRVITTYQPDEQMLQVKIVDTGVGIKEEDKDRLFKLFGCVQGKREKIST